MKRSGKSAKIVFTSEERAGLGAAFGHLLDDVEQTGGRFVELEALFVTLSHTGKDGAVQSLQQKIGDLLETVIPHELTLSQAGELYDRKAATLRRACCDGRLPGRKCGKTWLVQVEDLEKHLGIGPSEI